MYNKLHILKEHEIGVHLDLITAAAFTHRVSTNTTNELDIVVPMCNPSTPKTKAEGVLYI